MKRALFYWLWPVWVVGLLLACSGRGGKDDGLFQQSVPENAGVHTEGILRFLDEIQTKGIDLHSLMIIRHGKAITEGYWYPYQSSYRHIMHSVSKTFTSTAIGFAVQEKLLTVNDKVVSFFPDELPPVVSPYLEELTIKHLLTMSAGQEPAPAFSLDDGNWVKLFLATPVVHQPGSVFLYNSYASYMLSAIIQKVTGETTFDYLKPRLLDPLGITDASWEEGAGGISAGGWGMRIKTRDMARLGQFYLQEGRWNGQQLLSKDWIKAATSLQIYQQREPLSLEEELHGEWVQGYGYQIWRCTNNAYRADGANGQLVIVMPEQDAVVIITENTTDAQQTIRLVFEHLLPAMTDLNYAAKEDLKEQLASKLSALSIPDPFRTVEEMETPKDISFAYTLTPSDQHLQQAALAFDKQGNCRLTLTMDDKPYSFAFGLDTWQYGLTEKPSPYFLVSRRNPAGLSPFAVAGYGSWTSKNELNLRLLYIEDYQEENYNILLDGDHATISITNSQQPENKPVILTATRN
jgi:CubicO group peptidase (beta-lactamase class C family)